MCLRYLVKNKDYHIIIQATGLHKNTSFVIYFYYKNTPNRSFMFDNENITQHFIHLLP